MKKTNTPTFNLKVVVKETGIKPHTLRAWERRYGLPQPRRSSGGHRLYTQRDIDIVKWLMARQDEGLTIGRAAELWFSLVEKGEDPLAVAAFQTEILPLAGNGGATVAEIRQQWIRHCLKFDEAGAERVLVQAFSLYPVQMVCVEVLQKGLSQVGALWHRNEATVQQEHFTSALTIRRLDALFAAAPPPNRIGRILIACPPLEEHTIPLLLLSLLLRYRGWEVIFLRANVPLAQLESTIDTIKPNLVIMSAQRLQTAATMQRAAHLMQNGVSMAFGGLIFNMVPDLHHRIPGHFLGETIAGAVPLIGQIMAFTLDSPQIGPPPQSYASALEVYNAQRAVIEYETLQALAQTPAIPYEYLESTHARVSESIMAGLRLGNLAFIDAEMDLERELIGNYNISLDWQISYFDAYFQAADRNLNGRGRPIVEWLQKVCSSLQSS